jgi:X-Pro dipeptidyl-peptidase
MRERHTDLSRRSVLKGASAMGAASTLPATGGVAMADPEREGDKPDMDELDPERYDYDAAIREFAQIRTRTGAEIWVDVIRPDTDEAVPTIMVASPYYNTLGRGWKGELKEPHEDTLPPTAPWRRTLYGDPSYVPFPEWYDEYFVPRGYAVALMDLRGTRNSSGCQTYGDRDEVYDAVDVIDHLVETEWSNGAVGMTGGSYDGTIAVGAAAEQPQTGRNPEALKAIIPIRAIGRWYDYAFVNGAQIAAQSLITPSLFTAAFPSTDTQNAYTDDERYPLHVLARKACMGTFGAAVSAGHASPYQDATDEFWRERSFTKSAGLFNTPTFIIHGLFDYNVKTHNIGYLWERLPEDLPKKLWLFNDGHNDPHDPRDPEEGGANIYPFQEKYVEAVHRWFCQHLKGVEAGALVDPTYEVQGADGEWRDGGPYPASEEDLTLYLGPDGRTYEDGAPGGAAAYADGEHSTAPDSLTFRTDPFEDDTRVSGQFGFEFGIIAEGTDATVAVEILDVPPGADPGDAATTTMTPDRTAPLLVSYAWLRAWYRDSVPMRGMAIPHDGDPLSPGALEEVAFGSLYTDVVVPAGHRLAFRVSNAAGGTLGSEMGGDVRIVFGEEGSRVNVPVAPPATPAPGEG